MKEEAVALNNAICLGSQIRLKQVTDAGSEIVVSNFTGTILVHPVLAVAESIVTYNNRIDKHTFILFMVLCLVDNARAEERYSPNEDLFDLVCIFKFLTALGLKDGKLVVGGKWLVVGGWRKKNK